MSREEALERLNECQSFDVERAHSEADIVLCELLESLGYKDVVTAWGDVPKWYA
jgi:hypothetical protein